MSTLFRIIYASKANGTHHKLALDALRHLEVEAADDWRRLFLKHIDLYLEGAKAPDKEFKDFKNHVLHVGDGFWGGAPAKAAAWYGKLVRALSDRQFAEAVYCAGVLSHYYVDPLHPFHTAQSEAENNIHRAVEWSISKSYDLLRARGERDYAGLAVEAGDEPNWIEQMVRRGAERSHRYYDALISNYNFDLGVVDPLDGLNENSHHFLAELVIYAATGYARILDRAFFEAAVSPPEVSLSLDTFLASAGIPIRWITRRLADAADRRVVEATYDELKRTGKVEDTLSEDDRKVRALHRAEVIERRSIREDDNPLERMRRERKLALEARRRANPQAKTTPVVMLPAPYLSLNDELEKAPSIGSKTASRLARDGILTVAELLAADPLDLSAHLNTRWITENVIRDWQDQARLVSQIGGLRGGHAQLLVGAGLRRRESIGRMAANEIRSLLVLYCETKEGRRLRACDGIPGVQTIERWIAAANASVAQSAAA